MSKIYMNITLRVIIDTDLTSADDIVENLDISVVPNTETWRCMTQRLRISISQMQSNSFFFHDNLGTIRNG